MIEMCKTVAYYEYQMVLLALQNSEMYRVVAYYKSKIHTGSRAGRALMCTGMLCPYYKYKTACRCEKSENSLITKIYRRRRRTFLRIWYVCDG